MVKDFSSQKGAVLQEYFVYFKKLQRICGEKDSPAAAGDLIRDSYRKKNQKRNTFAAKLRFACDKVKFAAAN